MLHSTPSGVRRSRLYSRDDLLPLVNPASIAIVGASPRAGSFGARALANLKNFGGRVYPVNSRYEEIGGLRSYPSLSALPETPDCALLMVGRQAVEEVFRECVEVGVGGVIVHASGFAEVHQADAIAAQARLVELSGRSSTRLFGPNSLGIGNYSNGAIMTFGRMPPMRALGGQAIGLVCQSGAIGMALAQAMEHGVPVSHVFMLGNAGDVGLADCISYLADEPSCHAIACVFEGVDDPYRLVEAAEKALASGKPLIVYKMATGEQGAAAAMSHTGMLAGSDDAYRAVFARAGIVMVDNLEEVVETTRFFAKAGTPKARGTAVIVTSGGAGVLAADKAEVHKVDMPQPSAHTTEELLAILPEFASVRNPCDITAQVLNDESSFVKSIAAMMEDDLYGNLIVAHMFADETSTRRLPVFDEQAKKYGKIICNYWATEWLDGPGAVEAELLPNVALFRSLDRCMKTIAKWHERDTVLARGDRKPAMADHPARSAVAGLLENNQGGVISERSAKEILGHYGVPVSADVIVGSLDEALRSAEQIGYPIVLKVDSAAIPHKTEAGVIALNIGDAQTLRQEYRRVTENAVRVAKPAEINGVLVQPMIEAGLEILVGGRRDPVFGPLVVAGFGGVLVELLRDTVTLPIPATAAEIKDALLSLRGRALFDGYRGNARVDIDRLAQVISNVCAFYSNHADKVKEFDVNPLICKENNVVAADALIVVEQ